MVSHDDDRSLHGEGQAYVDLGGRHWSNVVNHLEELYPGKRMSDGWSTCEVLATEQ
jgi:hypothetical protein